MIYCVEGDAALRELMLYTLRATGFAARGFATGEALAAALRLEQPKLLLLGAGEKAAPEGDGMALLRQLRGAAATAQLPVIVLSDQASEYDKVAALDTGADDYLVKPFGMMELAARVRALLRRTRQEEQEEHDSQEAPEIAAPKILCAGDLTMDPASHLVRANGQRLHLTLKEYELLRTFLKHPGRVFTRDALLQRVWGMDYVGESRTVDVHIGTLRAKLKPSGVRLETVRGVGYRLAAEPQDE